MILQKNARSIVHLSDNQRPITNVSEKKCIGKKFFLQLFFFFAIITLKFTFAHTVLQKLHILQLKRRWGRNPDLPTEMELNVEKFLGEEKGEPPRSCLPNIVSRTGAAVIQKALCLSDRTFCLVTRVVPREYLPSLFYGDGIFYFFLLPLFFF
jgi:hypothetical protein